jgi:hypothetical protein
LAFVVLHLSVLQFPEKMIPKFTLLAARGADLPIHGDGLAVRRCAAGVFGTNGSLRIFPWCKVWPLFPGAADHIMHDAIIAQCASSRIDTVVGMKCG